MANVGKELAILTAGTPDHHNGCTVMYGTIGMIWRKDVYVAFVKPERYTYDFVKNSDYFTVAYFPEEYADVHKVYGYRSGRDTDKENEAGITPEILEHGIAYQEAKEIFVCKKIYMKQMDRAEMPEDVIADYNDPNYLIYGEVHYEVIGEIVEHIVR